MNILFISSYSSWYKISEKKMPAHHLYGIDGLVDHYEKYSNGEIYGVLKDGGIVDFFEWNDKKTKIISQVLKLKKISKKYDIIYDSLNRCSIYLGFLKKFKLFKTKLITVMHHPPYKIELKIANSNKYIFFSKLYLDYALKECPKKKGFFVVNEWMPDKNWYHLLDEYDINKTGFFIDNGRARRDKEILIKAANECKIPVVYAATKCDLDDNQSYAIPYVPNMDDDFAILKSMKKYKALILPVLKGKKEGVPIGPLGATSFLDAIALGYPVLVSDNVYFANVVQEQAIGLVYRTGDLNDLKEKMKLMYENNELMDRLTLNMINYGKERDISKYSEKLKESIDELIG